MKHAHAFLTALLLIPLAAPLAAETPANLALFDGNYPRAFFFRSCEGGPSRPGMTYEKWEADYDRLMGIIGKALDEEVIGREARNHEWFTRFKRDNPRQVVLLHFNGNARDPRHGTEKYFPGHWIYRQAVAITADVPAENGETVVPVSDVSDFQVRSGRYKTSNDDIALFALTPEGAHDWAHCEQVQLVSIDKQARTIRVKRGCYGTKPLAFKAGQARAAAHMVEGPWGKNNHIMWYYNFATHCPQDPQGKTCADHLVDDLAAWFGKGGKLEAFDGLEFDVMWHETRGDTNGDGLPDNGVIAGINRYGIGMHDFARQLRSRLGDRRIIQGDGALGPGGILSQRAMASLNGIESEGFPNLRDWDFDDWSGGLNRHNFWQANARPPVFNYINHKWTQGIPGKPGEIESPDVPFSRHRLAFAAAQFTDAVLTYAFTPPSDASGRIAIWDELVGGKLNTPGWLGKPLGPAVRPAARTPDLLAGIGTPPGETLATRIGNADAANGAVTITPAADGTFSIRNIPANGSDLLVLLTVSAEPRKSYPPDMPRLLHVEVVSGALQSQMTWVNNRPFPAAFYFRDIRSASIDLNFKIEGNEPVVIHQLTAHAHPDAIYRLFENGLVLANPSAKPYLFDLPTIAPDRKFSRIHGGPTQDPGTNNGQPIEESVTLAPLDAVFLRADHQSHGGL
jgi:hypothetical protein